MQTERVDIEDIQISKRLRPLDEKRVEEMMASIKEVGLKSPITIRFPAEGKNDDGTISWGAPILVAGHHRLEAARRLGWKDILAVVLDGDEREARLWEIAENLHRAELTALERAEHIAEWERLVSTKLVETPRPQGGRPGAAPETAKALGLSQSDVKRARVIGNMPDEAKQAAREAGLDDNQSALLKAARAPDPAAELRRLRAEKEAEEAARRNREADKAIRLTAAGEFAEWLLARADLNEIPTLISWLQAARPVEVIACLRRAAA